MIARGFSCVIQLTNDWLFHRRLWHRMRTSVFAIRVLVLVTLVGCSTGAPASPVAPKTSTQTPPSSVVVEPTKLSPVTITPTIENGFSIYLLAQDTSPQQLAILSHLELEENPLLSINDIVSYRKATHEIELTTTGYNRIASLSVPVNGKAFAVCVYGQPIYAGAFWVGYSSLSFDGIVIDTISASKEHPVLQIQLGYPGPAFFHGDDPRSDPRILQALEQAGKLK
jgi:hypothetical protein